MRDLEDSIRVKVKYLNAIAKEKGLDYATSGSAGVDLRACCDSEVNLEPGQRHRFASGVAIEVVRPGIAGFVYSRSGLGTKQGLVVSQGVGVIDSDYRGEILISLLNTSDQRRTVVPGQRIAQLVFMPVFQAQFKVSDELTTTDRGSGGFGHTGKE